MICPNPLSHFILSSSYVYEHKTGISQINSPEEAPKPGYAELKYFLFRL